MENGKIFPESRRQRMYWMSWCPACGRTAVRSDAAKLSKIYQIIDGFFQHESLCQFYQAQ